MPYIEAKFSSKLTEEKIEALKTAFGKAIECIPGKSESWLMVNIEDNKKLFFKGNADADTAYLSVSVFGNAQKTAYEALTEKLCEAVYEIVGVSPERTYITYSEYDKWGWNGSNF